MRLRSQLLCVLTILTTPIFLYGQQSKITTDPGILARLEYATSSAMSRGDLRHVCLAISNDGEYQIVRSTNEKPTQYFRGQMPKDQFERLKSLLSVKEFRSQQGTVGALILQDAESFRAEMPKPLKQRADGSYEFPLPEPWRLEWLNPDDSAPFPHSIDKVVRWLQNFEPKDGEEFSYTEFSQACPSGGIRLVQPSIAGNQRP